MEVVVLDNKKIIYSGFIKRVELRWAFVRGSSTVEGENAPRNLRLNDRGGLTASPT